VLLQQYVKFCLIPKKGYTSGPSTPERVFEIREVITDLDDSIEQAIK